MDEKFALPAHVSQCCAALRRAGYQAHPVGGCVRDLLLGRAPGDWDVCASALPEQTSALFPRTVPTGLRHGTVTILTDGGPIEVTTFRRESSYSDGRHPDAVTFGVSLADDLSRRDFTVNAMALDEGGSVIDLFGGRSDLNCGLIRCVGRPNLRFSEDALRMLRAVRFSAQLRFGLHEETAAAIRRLAHLTARLSPERIRTEVEKTLLTSSPETAGMLFDFGLIPGLPAGQPRSMTALATLPADPLPRWAGLCGCLIKSGLILDASSFLSALRLDGGTLRACAAGEGLWREALPASPAGWRRALSRLGPDACRAAAVMEGAEALSALEEVTARRPCVTVRQLALSGGELAALGFTGPAIGAAQRRLLAHVLEHPEDNHAHRLRELLDQAYRQIT